MDWNASLSISVLSCICGTNHHVTPVSVTPLRSAACQGLVLPKTEQKLGMRDELCGKVASVSDMDLYTVQVRCKYTNLKSFKCPSPSSKCLAFNNI